jgi:hypothetical protein
MSLTKNESIPNGHIIQKPFAGRFDDKDYKSGNLVQKITGLVCEEDNPPQYQNDSGMPFGDNKLKA